jgi:hypothetical protein
MPLSITKQPTDLLFYQGEARELQAEIAGSAPFDVTWLKDGTVIKEQNGLTSTALSQLVGTSGKYKLLVSNALGEVSSREAVVTAQAFHLTSPRTESSTLFLFDLPSQTNRSYVLELSWNLTDWLTEEQFSGMQGSMTRSRRKVAETNQFFRVRLK